MPLHKLQFKPGINTETTAYANEGGWFDCNLVRFRMGAPEKMRGWTKFTREKADGAIRNLFAWADHTGERFLSLGTSSKIYAVKGGLLNNITPVRRTADGLTNPLSTASGSAVVTVEDAEHGAALGDYVTLSGAVATGGLPASKLNAEHEITRIVSSDTIEITLDAAASSAEQGGGTVKAVYQLSVGNKDSLVGTGFGASPYGFGEWGGEWLESEIRLGLRLVTQDIYREDLVFCIRDDCVCYWDVSENRTVFGPAVSLDSIPGADGYAPARARQVLVSDIDRHVIAFGCTPLEETLAAGGDGSIDPLLIRFSDADDPKTWLPNLGENTAGDIRLGGGNEIITAVHTRQETLVFTERSLSSMQYVGPPLTFSIAQISGQTTIMSPGAVAAVGGLVFWMGKEDFHVYDGTVSKLDCAVRDRVFNNFNRNQENKVAAGNNSAHNEIWWFYPSARSDENDRYVVYNHREDLWYFGALGRGFWLDRAVYEHPLAAGVDGYVYEHENSLNDGSVEPEVGLDAWLESSQMDIGDGEQFTLVRRVIHDVTFDGSATPNPKMNVVLKSRNWPGTGFTETVASSVERTATLPIEKFTQKSDVRLRGRSFVFRYESSETDIHWRAGSPRVDIRTDGRR